MRGILRPLPSKALHRETIEKIQRVSRARACGDERLRELVKREYIRQGLINLPDDDFRKIAKEGWVMVPIKLITDYLVIERCRPHSCTSENAVLVVNLYDGSMHEGFWNEDEKDLRKMRWFSTKGNYKDLPKEILDSWYRDKGLALTKQPAEVKTPGPSTQPLPGAVPGPGEQAQQVSRDTAATIGFAQQQHPYFPLQRNTTWTYRSPEAVDPSMVSETVKVVEVN